MSSFVVCTVLYTAKANKNVIPTVGLQHADVQMQNNKHYLIIKWNPRFFVCIFGDFGSRTLSL